uniref:Uncharacterized protein n=1 Tax=Macrostomum lignano TaxID=282301 RepID=A0A1I8IPE0_9PLAT
MADEGLLLVCPEQQVPLPPNVAQIHSIVAVSPPNDVAAQQFNSGDEQHISRQSDQTLPGSEGRELCSDRFVAVLGPHQKLEDFQFLECANVKVECAKTLDSFQLALSKVLAPLTPKTELWFFHLLLVDINNSLIMDGKAVSENEAYKLIHSMDLSRVSIFQFVLRLPVEVAKFNEAAPFWNKSPLEARQRRRLAQFAQHAVGFGQQSVSRG